METANPLSAETAEILQSLTFIEKECIAAWQGSAKTGKELGLLREARACIQLKMKLLGIGARKPAPVPVSPEPPAPSAEPTVSSETAAPAAKPDEALLKVFREQYSPEYFRKLHLQARTDVLRRHGLTEADLKKMGY